MCRINGIVNKNVAESLVVAMRDTLCYGGPDDGGVFIDQEAGVGLGHRRLAIIDLSPAGHQPMCWNEWTIVFNGEIYNYKAITHQLEQLGYSFQTGSDTEVILKAFDQWGYRAVEHFRGMFAFALWNKITKKLLLCRDRVGVKPLYWYQKDDLFLFASELKAFHQHPDFDKTISQEAVSLFLQTGYIKAPYAIFKYAHKLLPGSFLELDTQTNEIKIWKYWNARDIYQNTAISQAPISAMIEQCEAVLTESVNLRMVADVPVGVFLSGGIDSSIVTALLQKNATKPLNTFTIGFEDTNFNEAHHAKEVAKHLGTHHTELYCTETDFDKIVPQLPNFYDEPFGDSSGIPTFLVSQLARQEVTVSLSADGGDEVFTGYNRYLFVKDYYSKLKHIPAVLKNITSTCIENTSVQTIKQLSRLCGVSEQTIANLDNRIPKLVEALKSKNEIDFLYNSTVYITPQNLRKLCPNQPIASVFDRNIVAKNDSLYSLMGLLDIESYLEGDILAKIDRATMQVALEGREPLLDHKIIEFAFALPDAVKLREGKTKWILRQILYQYVPEKLIERPKMGFGIPLDRWLGGMLKIDLIHLSEDKIFAEAFMLNHHILKDIIQNYINQKYNSPYFVWFLYVLHQWYLKWIK